MLLPTEDWAETLAVLELHTSEVEATKIRILAQADFEPPAFGASVHESFVFCSVNLCQYSGKSSNGSLKEVH